MGIMTVLLVLLGLLAGGFVYLMIIPGLYAVKTGMEGQTSEILDGTPEEFQDMYTERIDMYYQFVYYSPLAILVLLAVFVLFRSQARAEV